MHHPLPVTIPETLSLLGMCLVALTNASFNLCDRKLVTQAVEYVQLVLALFPDSSKFLTFAAQLCCMLGERERAIALCERAIQLNAGSQQSVQTIALIRRYTPEPHEWPTAAGQSARTGFTHARVTTPLSLAWTFETPGSIAGGIAASAGVAVFGTGLGGEYHLFGVDLRFGREVWRHPLEGALLGTCAIYDGRVFSGTARSAMSFDLTTGRMVWRTNSREKESAHPLRNLAVSTNCPLCIDALAFFGDETIAIYDSATGVSLTK